VPGVELRIAADGEVLVRGANITPGYWHDAQATGAAFSDGWYRTGDLGQLDAEGRLVLHGRKKDMIVLANGQNVFPVDVENAFSEVGDLRDVAVVGMPSPSGAQVHAVLLPGATEIDARAVVQAANARLAPHQQVQGFTVWPEADFPRTHTMKVRKQEVLRMLLAQRETAGQSPAQAIQAARDATPVRRLIAEAAGKQDLTLSAEATLGGDWGLDSLARVELLAAIESELGVYLDETRVREDTTVADLEAMVAAQESSTRPVFPRWPLGPAARLARAALQAPAFALLDGIAPARVSGLESLCGVMPPALFVANHTSHLDSAVLIRALPRTWRRRLAVAAAADYFFTRQLLGQSVALALNAFPFSREGNIRPTIEHSAWLLDHGWSIVIFPEGTRSTTGEMAPFKAGTGLLAVELQVPVVPVRLTGLRDVLPKGQVVPHRSHIGVHFGPPLRFTPGTPYAEATQRIEAAVCAL
jgi:long-chain acyl-CoA synthetase